MRILLLDKAAYERINDAVAKARANVVPWAVLQRVAIRPHVTEIKLEDRKLGSEAVTKRAQQVLIARGYRAAISFEEQPAGIIRHLSVSVDTPGMMPSPEAVNALLIAFGFAVIEKGTSTIWVEEFDPGHEAVNIAQMEQEAQPAGHA